jgi:hypothetical protein
MIKYGKYNLNWNFILRKIINKKNNWLQGIFLYVLIDIKNYKPHLLIAFDHLTIDNYQKMLIEILMYLIVPYKMVCE